MSDVCAPMAAERKKLEYFLPELRQTVLQQIGAHNLDPDSTITYYGIELVLKYLIIINLLHALQETSHGSQLARVVEHSRNCSEEMEKARPQSRCSRNCSKEMERVRPLRPTQPPAQVGKPPSPFFGGRWRPSCGDGDVHTSISNSYLLQRQGWYTGQRG